MDINREREIFDSQLVFFYFLFANTAASSGEYARGNSKTAYQNQNIQCVKRNISTIEVIVDQGN